MKIVAQQSIQITTPAAAARRAENPAAPRPNIQLRRRPLKNRRLRRATTEHHPEVSSRHFRFPSSPTPSFLCCCRYADDRGGLHHVRADRRRARVHRHRLPEPDHLQAVPAARQAAVGQGEPEGADVQADDAGGGQMARVLSPEPTPAAELRCGFVATANGGAVDARRRARTVFGQVESIQGSQGSSKGKNKLISNHVYK